MNNKRLKNSVGNTADELDHAIAEAIDYFAQHNIRFRTPNRNAGYSNQEKWHRLDRKNG